MDVGSKNSYPAGKFLSNDKKIKRKTKFFKDFK
jgi:hypothetical protein